MASKKQPTSLLEIAQASQASRKGSRLPRTPQTERELLELSQAFLVGRIGITQCRKALDVLGTTSAYVTMILCLRRAVLSGEITITNGKG